MIQNPTMRRLGGTTSIFHPQIKSPKKIAAAFSEPCPIKAGLVLVRSSKFASNGASTGAGSDRADTAAPAGTPSPARDERSRARCHWRPGIAIVSDH